jgi:hypothetical protein
LPHRVYLPRHVPRLRLFGRGVIAYLRENMAVGRNRRPISGFHPNSRRCAGRAPPGAGRERSHGPRLTPARRRRASVMRIT